MQSWRFFNFSAVEHCPTDMDAIINVLKFIQSTHPQLFSRHNLASHTLIKETALHKLQQSNVFPLERVSDVYELETKLTDDTFQTFIVSIQPLSVILYTIIVRVQPDNI